MQAARTATKVRGSGRRATRQSIVKFWDHKAPRSVCRHATSTRRAESARPGSQDDDGALGALDRGAQCLTHLTRNGCPCNVLCMSCENRSRSSAIPKPTTEESSTLGSRAFWPRRNLPRHAESPSPLVSGRQSGWRARLLPHRSGRGGLFRLVAVVVLPVGSEALLFRFDDAPLSHGSSHAVRHARMLCRQVFDPGERPSHRLMGGKKSREE